MSTRAARESRRARIAAAAHDVDRRHRRTVATIWAAGFAVVVTVVAFMLVTSKPVSLSEARRAPTFTLPTTSGETVSLADYRGRNVVIYFNEGAGCQSCLVQMAEIEKSGKAFGDLDITVLPVVMNTREQILKDMELNGVRTPFLLDDGTVSQAYGTLGRGMHAGLPGHSFVLIDREGQQLWYGEYPSMWLSPEDLLKEVRSRLKP